MNTTEVVLAVTLLLAGAQVWVILRKTTALAAAKDKAHVLRQRNDELVAQLHQSRAAVELGDEAREAADQLALSLTLADARADRAEKEAKAAKAEIAAVLASLLRSERARLDVSAGLGTVCQEREVWSAWALDLVAGCSVAQSMLAGEIEKLAHYAKREMSAQAKRVIADTNTLLAREKPTLTPMATVAAGIAVAHAAAPTVRDHTTASALAASPPAAPPGPVVADPDGSHPPTTETVTTGDLCARTVATASAGLGAVAASERGRA